MEELREIVRRELLKDHRNEQELKESLDHVFTTIREDFKAQVLAANPGYMGGDAFSAYSRDAHAEGYNEAIDDWKQVISNL